MKWGEQARVLKMIPGLEKDRVVPVGRRRGGEPSAPPRTRGIGALGYYAAHADPKHYVPSNIAFGLIPPLDRRVKSRKDRNIAISERALNDLADWEAGLMRSATARGVETR